MANKEYENKFKDKGYKNIVGVDEAGRGPLAGPLIIAAVILPSDYENKEINDSKKLTDKKRRELFKIINEVALEIKVLVIEPEIIDKLNIYDATKKGMEEILKLISLPYDAVLVDAMKLDDVSVPTLSLVKGDLLSQSIAAASIIAKVTRDNIMLEYDKKYPQYDFKNNKGYGTKKHLEALDKYGITKIHRLSYKPVILAQNIKLDI